MTIHVPRLPLSLDPLIAEAKRRSRQRRLLLAVLGIVAVAGAAIGGTLAARGSERSLPALGAWPTCRRDQLHLSLSAGGVAGGTAGQTLTLRNTSGSACSLHGWPSFRFVMRDGRVIVPHPHDLIATAYRVSNPPPIPHVLLRPGGAAPLIVSEADGTGYEHPCQLTRTVLVVPPGVRVPLSPTSTRLLRTAGHVGAAGRPTPLELQQPSMSSGARKLTWASVPE
jgi:Domain of unknown function (DUF4232)